MNRIPDGLSVKRIMGFACNQAFVFFLFYLGVNRSFASGGLFFERVDLIFTLLFMTVGFVIIRSHSRVSRQWLLKKAFLVGYGVVMAASSASIALMPDLDGSWLVMCAAFLGFAAALLLTAWGRSFGALSVRTFVTEVFSGSLVAAFMCLGISSPQNTYLLLVMHVLPLASAVIVDAPKDESASPHPALEEGAHAAVISMKVLAGTVCFGAAAGLMETFGTEPGTAAIPYHPMSLLIFAAFAIGALSLLVSDGFGKGAALNKSYRTAVFVMLFGFIAAPLTQALAVPLTGESMVLAGYLGLQAMLICLFLLLSKVNGIDASVSFSWGFTALFAGELAGVLAANAADAVSQNAVTPYAVVVSAGVLVLTSYVFLFSERDFSSLTEIAGTHDVFDEACAEIAQTYKLSKRESEILPFALRGRTAERIAGELTISKSTVDTHIRRIYAKVGVSSRQELIDVGEETSKSILKQH